MASYGLDERFHDPRYCFRLNDPGAYNNIRGNKCKQNKRGFSSSTPRVTLTCSPNYTDNIYDARIDSKIPNATCFKSKVPRFIHKPFTEEELDEILCRCGIEKTCECPLGEEKECQARVYKRLFKGPPPHSVLGVGLSIPSKRDRGFEILHDGTSKRLIDEATAAGPDFYDATVHRFTDFFRGCKWSQWKAPRKEKSLEVKPGPADYYIEREKTQFEICAEKVRADRRKNSKQLRFIELVQNRNILENRPGPADYTPRPQKGTDLHFLGPKAKRFLYQYEQSPSPAAYSVKRDFDLPEPPDFPCRAKLPFPAGFGVSAQRFKEYIQDTPGPEKYDARVELCRIVNCSKAPFGRSAKIFKESELDFVGNINEDEDELIKEEDEETRTCPAHTWPFKSKTKRFKSYKTFDPYIPNITKAKVIKRSLGLQALAPFNISQVRFQNWYDWLPVHAGTGTPGPAYYQWNKPYCLPAVNSGPLFRARRFRKDNFVTPAPNEYKIEGHVDAVLDTYNKRLQQNVKKSRVQFKWTRKETKLLSFLEREQIILNRAIKQLEIEPSTPEITRASLVVLKEEEDYVPESNRVSLSKGKRVTGDKKEQDSTDEEEKHVSVDKGGKRATIEESEKRFSADRQKKLASFDESKRPRDESPSSILKKEKHHSTDKEVTLMSDKEVTLKVDEAVDVLEKSEVKKIAIEPPKKKLLRTFLYNHPTQTYF